LGDVMYSSTHS